LKNLICCTFTCQNYITDHEPRPDASSAHTNGSEDISDAIPSLTGDNTFTALTYGSEDISDVYAETPIATLTGDNTFTALTYGSEDISDVYAETPIATLTDDTFTALTYGAEDISEETPVVTISPDF